MSIKVKVEWVEGVIPELGQRNERARKLSTIIILHFLKHQGKMHLASLLGWADPSCETLLQCKMRGVRYPGILSLHVSSTARLLVLIK